MSGFFERMWPTGVGRMFRRPDRNEPPLKTPQAELMNSNFTHTHTHAIRSVSGPGPRLSSNHVRSELLVLHQDLVVQLRTEAACPRRFGANGSADMLKDMIVQHEKAAEVLRAHLATQLSEPPLVSHVSDVVFAT
jgi:hypothetical protein